MPVTVANILAAVTSTPQTREAIEERVRQATGRGTNAVRSAFREVLSANLLKVDAEKRAGTNPIRRYWK